MAMTSIRHAFRSLLSPTQSRTHAPADEWAAERQSSLDFHRQTAAEENEQSRIPPGEAVAVPCLWVAEVYFASHIPGLIRSLDARGWAAADWDLGTRHDLGNWIRSIRRRGKGAGRYGGPWISSRKSNLSERHGYRTSADLPQGVTGFHFDVYQPSPNFAVIVTRFLLEASFGDRITEALRIDYDVEIEALARGWNVIEPSQARTIAVERVRSELVTMGSEFVAEHLPGFFAGLDADSSPLPTGELFLLRSTSLSGSEEPTRKGFLDSLGLGFRFSDFLGISEHGLVLRLPSDSGAHERGLTFAASTEELLPDDPLSGYGDGRTPSGFAHRLHDHGVSAFMGLWAVHVAIADLDAELAEIRDRIGVEVQSLNSETGLIEQLRRGVEVLVADSIFALDEWSSGSGLRYLTGDAADFQLREASRLGQGPLVGGLTDTIQEDAARILKAVATLRDALQIQSSLVASQASARAAQTNLELQWVNIALVVLALIVALFAMFGSSASPK
jgi:hypothetical protein